MINNVGINTCCVVHPQENLPYTERHPESDFARQFATTYQRAFKSIHHGTTRERTVFAREVPVHGHGIADLVVLCWEGSRRGWRGGRLEGQPTIRSFEVKISDWRAGLMQAHRYRYFSNASILVVPNHKLGMVQSHFDLFRVLRIGLWGFNPETNVILSVYTPRPRCQPIRRHAERAVETILEAALRR